MMKILIEKFQWKYSDGNLVNADENYQIVM